MENLSTSPKQDPAHRNLHPMVVLQPGERVIGTIKRHPFGIISVYIGVLLAAALAAWLGSLTLPDVLETADQSTRNMIFSGLALALVTTILVLGIATMIYWQNQWVVTTDSVTQITQSGLFSRQVSQLSLENLEDVTVDQHGIIPHMLNFGTLKAESAGERSKFVFPYCPNPNGWARQILDVHEKFLEERRNIQQLQSHHPTMTSNSAHNPYGYNQLPPNPPNTNGPLN